MKKGVIEVAVLSSDHYLSAQVIRNLSQEGYEHKPFQDADKFLSAIGRAHFDLFVIDADIPENRGNAIIQRIRGDVGEVPPILLVGSRLFEEELAAAFAAGADDYMRKPARNAEMAARICALLRRAYPYTMDNSVTFTVGPYTIDPSRRIIEFAGSALDVAPREFDLALILFRNRGRLVPHEVMESAVWGRPMGPDSRTLNTHLSRLRQKLRLGKDNPVKLTSVYSQGYRIDVVDVAITKR